MDVIDLTGSRAAEKKPASLYEKLRQNTSRELENEIRRSKRHLNQARLNSHASDEEMYYHEIREERNRLQKHFNELNDSYVLIIQQYPVVGSRCHLKWCYNEMKYSDDPDRYRLELIPGHTPRDGEVYHIRCFEDIFALTQQTMLSRIRMEKRTHHDHAFLDKESENVVLEWVKKCEQRNANASVAMGISAADTTGKKTSIKRARSDPEITGPDSATKRAKTERTCDSDSDDLSFISKPDYFQSYTADAKTNQSTTAAKESDSKSNEVDDDPEQREKQKLLDAIKAFQEPIMDVDIDFHDPKHSLSGAFEALGQKREDKTYDIMNNLGLSQGQMNFLSIMGHI